MTYGDLPVQEWIAVGIFVIFACLWDLLLDGFVDWWGSDPLDSPGMQALNALNFVLTTGVLLYIVLRRSFRARRRAEAAARLSHQRFEAVAVATTNAIWEWDLITDVMWMSDRFRSSFGLTEPARRMSLEDWLRKIHPEDRDRVSLELRRIADGASTQWKGQYRARRSDGTYAHVIDHTSVLHDPTGNRSRIVGGIRDITERVNAERAAKDYYDQLRALSARLQSAREQEGARIAREIHDELGQVLTAMKLNLDWLEERLDGGSPTSVAPLVERLVQTSEMAEDAIASVQRIASDLRPVALDLLGLPAAVEQEARRVAKSAGLECEIELPTKEIEIGAEVATAVFRILQESLTNVVRHAQATRVRVTLRTNRDRVELEVADDGIGIPEKAWAAASSLGLLGMRERASAHGGEIKVERASGGGTTVCLVLPVGSPRLTNSA